MSAPGDAADLAALRRRPWQGPAPISRHAIEQAAARHGIRPDYVDALAALRCIAQRRGAVLMRDNINPGCHETPRQLWLVLLCGKPVQVVLALRPEPFIVTVLPHGACTSGAVAAARQRPNRAGRSAQASRHWRQARQGAGAPLDLEDA